MAVTEAAHGAKVASSVRALATGFWPEELPPFGGNAQLGCGLAARELKGHRYLYFWAYEARSWGSRRKWTYVGPMKRVDTRLRAQRLLLEYHHRAQAELERRIRALEVAAHNSSGR